VKQVSRDVAGYISAPRGRFFCALCGNGGGGEDGLAWIFSGGGGAGRRRRDSSLAKGARRWGGGPLFATRRTKNVRRKKPGCERKAKGLRPKEEKIISYWGGISAAPEGTAPLTEVRGFHPQVN